MYIPVSVIVGVICYVAGVASVIVPALLWDSHNKKKGGK